MASTGHDNYKTKTSIDFTEINTSKPLSLKDSQDNINTFDNVFGGLNKIIKTFINTHIEHKNQINKIYERFRCISGDISVADTTYTIESGSDSSTISQDYLISDTEYYSHGYIKYPNIRFSSLGVVPISTTLMSDVTIYDHNIYNSEWGGNSSALYGSIKVKASIIHPSSGGTAIRLTTTFHSTHETTFTSYNMAALLIAYELY